MLKAARSRMSSADRLLRLLSPTRFVVQEPRWLKDWNVELRAAPKEITLRRLLVLL